MSVMFTARGSLNMATNMATEHSESTDVRSRLQAVVTWSSADHTFVASLR